MLFYVVPLLLRRVTVRNSIEGKKEGALIREVALDTKQGLLRDYVRLVQLVNLERRAVENSESWTHTDPRAWNASDAAKMFERGLQKFRRLPQDVQLDIWKIFASWDANNDSTVDEEEFSDTLKALGFSQTSMRAASNLLRLVDHDEKKELSWRKFKALITLATVDRPQDETQEDLETFFKLIDVDGDEEITIFELAQWSANSKVGMDKDDFATLLYKFFQGPKATVKKEEFIDWVRPCDAALQT